MQVRGLAVRRARTLTLPRSRMALVMHAAVPWRTAPLRGAPRHASPRRAATRLDSPLSAAAGSPATVGLSSHLWTHVCVHAQAGP